MLLLNKPHHRNFPSDSRYKVAFEPKTAESILPPLYVYIDNTGRWHIDTFWLTPTWRTQINTMFEALYKAHFEILTVPKILEAVEYADALRTLDAQLKGDSDAPMICVRYYDEEVSHLVPGNRIRIQKIHCNDIFDDITRP